METPMSVVHMHPLLEVHDLSVRFGAAQPAAVKDFAITMEPGEIVGLVGESGSGKSVTVGAINRLLSREAQVTVSRMTLNGVALDGLEHESLRRLRGAEIGMIFQDPMSTLNPLMTVQAQLREAIEVHASMPRAEMDERIAAMLMKLRFLDIPGLLRAYPHELSGGMRQRIAIACALINRPKLLFADEPTTALDVTVEAEVVDLVATLCRENHTAVLWITHDLSLLENFADRVMVMYAGEVVETGSVREVFDRPAHPYTCGLLDSMPARNMPKTRLPQIPGTLDVAARTTAGCSFASRCAQAQPGCSVKPPMKSLGQGRASRCHYGPLAMGAQEAA
jgi:peptide/nickel transport system ATP-binding protein